MNVGEAPAVWVRLADQAQDAAGGPGAPLRRPCTACFTIAPSQAKKAESARQSGGALTLLLLRRCKMGAVTGFISGRHTLKVFAPD